MSQFFYGSFVHEPYEVYPSRISIQTVVNGVNIPWHVVVTMEVKGTLCKCASQSELNTKMDALYDAYRYHYKDAGFFLADGVTISEHYMRSDDPLNLTGNIVKSFSWDNVEDSEFANVRSYTIVIEAKYETSYNSLLDLSETITVQGVNEPYWDVNSVYQGAQPVYYGTNQFGGPVIVTQEGFMVSKDIPGFAVPGPWFPEFENKKARIISSTSGRPWGGPHNTLSFGYRRTWHYQMKIPVVANPTPNSWASVGFNGFLSAGSGTLAYPPTIGAASGINLGFGGHPPVPI